MGAEVRSVTSYQSPITIESIMLKIGILLGDDIGLEVVPEAVKVIAQAQHLTADLGGKASTTQMGDAVVQALGR